MLKVGIIGVGNAGSQVGALGTKMYSIPSVAINSSENDLATIPDNVMKFTVGDSRGAGKDRTEAKEFLKESVMKLLQDKDFINFCSDADVIFIISSTGGGTGSGIAPMLADILGNAVIGLSIILVSILPQISEAYSAQVNTVEYLKEVYNVLEDSTMMIYDNDKLSNLSSFEMMTKINESIIKDIKVIQGTYNLATKYSSIDEKDMTRIITTPRRIVVASVEDIKAKDLDKMTIEDMLIENIKSNAHCELQRDQKVARTGLILNLHETMLKDFDDHISKVQDFIGSPVEEFQHIHVNEEASVPNSVYLVMSGLSQIDDRIQKITDRIAEIDALQNSATEKVSENSLDSIDINELNDRKKIKKQEKDVQNEVDITSIFDKFL